MHFEQQISGPVAVIGDIHGQTDQLQLILDQLQRRDDYERRWIVFIGDLVDRGPDPRGAIDLVLRTMASHSKTTAISGNHELAMAGALDLNSAVEESGWAARWLDHYGAQPTFESYGTDYPDLQILRKNLPTEHADYLRNLPWAIEHPEYYFVHSGLDPEMPFELQRRILSARDLTLRRPTWLCSKSLPFCEPPADCHKIVVSGHAYVPRVIISRKRLLIDTTGGHGGSLSCVLLPEQKVLHSDESSAEDPLWEPQRSIHDLIDRA